MDIAALLSGGVDSSVVVHLLCEQGYKPTLFYIKIGMDGVEYMDCSAEEDIELSTAIARRYGLALEVVDLHREYWDNVAAYAIEKIRKGQTPNPDVMCNKLIKFGCFEQRVGKDFDLTATGHYATTLQLGGKTWLGTAKDPIKDQTDFLAQIDYLQVSKLLFPIGGLMKHEVREIALQAGLPSARRKDSQGICFLGKINYNDFVRRFLGEKEGAVIEYEFRMKDFNFITDNPWEGSTGEEEVTFKIRHTPEFIKGRLLHDEEGYRIISSEKLQGIAPGQFGVIYDAESRVCFGSGEIG